MTSEVVVRVDEKGRILIPAKFRREMGFPRAVRVRLEGDVLIVAPMRDPIEELISSVKKGTKDVEKEIRKLRRKAEEQLSGEVG